MDELEPEMPDPRRAPEIEMRARFLRFGAENGVAAADVGHDGVRAAGVIAQFDAVLFAGAAAILVAGAVGEEAAEDAVLGVEDGQVLAGDGFDMLRARVARQIGRPARR